MDILISNRYPTDILLTATFIFLFFSYKTVSSYGHGWLLIGFGDKKWGQPLPWFSLIMRCHGVMD